MIEVQAGASGGPSEAIKQVAALAAGILALVAVSSLLNRMLLVITEDVLGGVQVVKALSRQGAEAARFRAANRAVHDHKL